METAAESITEKIHQTTSEFVFICRSQKTERIFFAKTKFEIEISSLSDFFSESIYSRVCICHRRCGSRHLRFMKIKKFFTLIWHARHASLAVKLRSHDVRMIEIFDIHTRKYKPGKDGWRIIENRSCVAASSCGKTLSRISNKVDIHTHTRWGSILILSCRNEYFPYPSWIFSEWMVYSVHVKNVEKFFIFNDGIPAVVESIFAIHLSEKSRSPCCGCCCLFSHKSIIIWAKQSYYTKQCSEWNIGGSTDPVRGRGSTIYAENISNMNNNFFRFTSIIKNDLYSCKKKREEEDPPRFPKLILSSMHTQIGNYFFISLPSPPPSCQCR